MQELNNLYEEKLDAALEELTRCQEQHQLKSCYECEESLACPIRSKYVRTVYESMSKGETGGFDF
jgi:hypothetical protein